MNKIIISAGIGLIVVLISLIVLLYNPEDEQTQEASNVIARILPGYADRFILKRIEKEGDKDVFEIEARNKKIIIRGSSGVAICRGFNYYLNNFCKSVYNWRCGQNLNISGELPGNFEKVRRVTPYVYRYMFNYCTFSYSMAFWDWDQWEKMIDWMALNGINMPLAPMGQEIIWQRVYKKFGLSEEDLKDFFVGPAYNAFGRMGCIDGYGGPLPQSWIENENLLQKKILKRERQLGMIPVLQGFTGHVPPAFAKKKPDLKFTNLNWIDFPSTYLLDWEEPLFSKIGKDFISELTKEYGTDHFYAIDQFIEMKPVNGDTLYLKNMSAKIFSTIEQADPFGKWVIQTWPFKDLEFWNHDRTKAYFDGVPDERMLALELWGESWTGTGWYKHSGWYGKPWVWCIIQNFGDQVSMYGGLTQITENFRKVLSDSEKGNLSGMGLMMEGLDYNPVVYALISDMMWAIDVPDLKKWEREYLESRYGVLNEDITNAWEYLFNYYYNKSGLFERNYITDRPHLVDNDIWPSELSVLGAKSLIGVANELQNVDAYQFDIVNLYRQVFGQYAGHLLFEITEGYKEKNIKKFDESVKTFFSLSSKLELLMASRKEFLFGKWIEDSKERSTNVSEERLYEWNARAIITTWGGRNLYGYALKDWAGMYSSYYLPRWKQFFASLRSDISGEEIFNYERFVKNIMVWEDDWLNLREENIPSIPSGNSVMLAGDLWDQYGGNLLNHH
jgi:alpha-N-acetylglucosaminidase